MFEDHNATLLSDADLEAGIQDFLDATGANDLMDCGHKSTESTQIDWNKYQCSCGVVHTI